MVSMLVSCKHCGSDFATPNPVDEAAFATLALQDTNYLCPACGQTATYSKDDHFFRAA